MARKSSRSKSKASSAKNGAPEGPKRIVLATNRKARHKFHIDTTMEAGLVLLGSEVKSLRNQTPTLSEGYARLEGEQLWLYGVHIAMLPQASWLNHEPMRKRLCLMHKREIKKLRLKLEAKGMTLVPLSLYFKGSRVKVELGLGRGRRKGDKRNREREKYDRKAIREHR